MEIYERAVDAGAAALVKGGVVCDPVTGDVLHDHDWTPNEAARAVLDAVNYRGAVQALESIDEALTRALKGKSPLSDPDWMAVVDARDLARRGGQ
jgi:pyridoxal biosynthesis lyase PdxS